MTKPKYSPVAIRDLEQMGDYIAEELKNPTAAMNTVSKVLDSVDKLEDTPDMGAPLSARYEHVDDYRYIICGNYLVFYRNGTDGVYIDRVLYEKMDYLTILFGKQAEQRR